MIYLTGRKTVPLELSGVPERTAVYHHDGWIVARASMHNHTVLSDGVREPEDLLLQAKQEGMAILAYTDHREGGFKIGKRLNLPINGIESIGYEAYLDRLNEIKSNEDELIILLGIEVAPFFYNTGKAPNFIIMNENMHFTVYNISDPQVFLDMPVTRDIHVKPDPLTFTEPYQKFVDYITEHGGIVHKVHPESTLDRWVGPIRFISRKHPEQIRSLEGLAGFSVLPEGYEIAARPGGAWDAALVEYLLGARDQVPWAMGDADYHGPNGSLARSTTMFYMREFSEDEVYNCLREGRMIALMGASFQDSYVTEFSVSDFGPPESTIMFGQKAYLSGPPLIRFSLNREVPEVRTLLIRNGKVIYETTDSIFEYTDHEMFDSNIPAVYRVEMIGPRENREPGESGKLEAQSELFTNPIFVYLEI